MILDVYKPINNHGAYIFFPENTDPSTFYDASNSQLQQLRFLKKKEIIPGQIILGVNSLDIINAVNTHGSYLLVVQPQSGVSEGGAAIGGGILGASIGGPIGALLGAIIGLALAENAKKGASDEF